MGTSSTYGGPKYGLEPPWVDNNNGGGQPAPDQSSPDGSDAPTEGGDGAGDGAEGNPPEQGPKIAAPPHPLKGSRGNFTRFTNSAKSSALSKAVKGYLASTNGGAGATRRMPNSTRVASGVASLVSSVATQGAAAALQRFNLQALAGRPATEVFEALVDHLCPDGGTIDEAIARDALIDTISVFANEDLGNFDQLTPEQLNEFLAEMITRSITTKVINEIGTNSLHGSASDEDFRRAEASLRDYTAGAVRDALGSAFNAQESLTDQQMEQRINDVFANSFEVLEAILENE